MLKKDDDCWKKRTLADPLLDKDCWLIAHVGVNILSHIDIELDSKVYLNDNLLSPGKIESLFSRISIRNTQIDFLNRISNYEHQDWDNSSRDEVEFCRPRSLSENVSEKLQSHYYFISVLLKGDNKVVHDSWVNTNIKITWRNC